MISSMQHIKHIVIDCDNTMGIEGRDIDDALALLYLIGNPRYAYIDAVCTTYGNSNINAVQSATTKLFETLKLTIPLYQGAATPHDLSSPAGNFLAEEIRKNPGCISLLAIGSTTNLKLAEQCIPGSLSRLREAAFMGGITQDLIMRDITVNELNFSCDPLATRLALEHIDTPYIATGNNCFPAYFSSEDFLNRMSASRTTTGAFFVQEALHWCTCNQEHFGTPGFICWDVVAAARLIHPEFFIDEFYLLDIAQCEWDRGYLSVEQLNGALDISSSKQPERPLVCLPRINDPAAFVEHCFTSWERACSAIDTHLH